MVEESHTTETKSSIGTFSKLNRYFEDGIFKEAELNTDAFNKEKHQQVTIRIVTFEQAKELHDQLLRLCTTFEAHQDT